jgi:hypothetical protein
LPFTTAVSLTLPLQPFGRAAGQTIEIVTAPFLTLMVLGRTSCGATGRSGEPQRFRRAAGTAYALPMTAVLLLVAACLAIVLIGWIVSKAKGSRAYFIESWLFDDGETVLWRDDDADVAVIPKLGQAVVMTPARLHRWPVVVTSSRVIIGNKTLTGKAMVKYVLYPSVSPDEESTHLDGGLLSRGYSTVVIQPEVLRDHLGDDEKHPYLSLTPVEGERSSTNISHFRISTDLSATFPPALSG